MREIERRVALLERPPMAGACLACDMERLNRLAAGDDLAPGPCTHPPRTLVQELEGLNTFKGDAHALD